MLIMLKKQESQYSQNVAMGRMRYQVYIQESLILPILHMRKVRLRDQVTCPRLKQISSRYGNETQVLKTILSHSWARLLQAQITCIHLSQDNLVSTQETVSGFYAHPLLCWVRTAEEERNPYILPRIQQGSSHFGVGRKVAHARDCCKPFICINSFNLYNNFK